mgnify:CR=1 FL=1
MNIVDSSFWIEYFGNGKNVDDIDNIINDTDNLLVPTVILAEVFKWVLRENGELDAIQAISVMKYGKVVDFTEIIALNSAYFSLKYKLSFADSIIYSFNEYFNSTLYTLDKHFKGLPNVKYFEKVD